MKVLIITIFMFFAMMGFAKEMVQYETVYRDVQVGVSSLADVVDQVGSPSAKTANSSNVKYVFDGFDVTIQDSTGRINTIIIRDSSFVDPNGIRLGTRRSTINILKDHIVDRVGHMVDYSAGIIYWLEDEAVVKIVFAYELPKQ